MDMAAAGDGAAAVNGAAAGNGAAAVNRVAVGGRDPAGVPAAGEPGEGAAPVLATAAGNGCPHHGLEASNGEAVNGAASPPVGEEEDVTSLASPLAAPAVLRSATRRAATKATTAATVAYADALPLSAAPGPTPFPIVGNALDVAFTGLNDVMLSYARRYGPFVKFQILGDRLLLLTDPEALHHVLSANARNYLGRWVPIGFERLLYAGTLRGLVFSQGKYWAVHRRAASGAFRSPALLQSFCDSVGHHASYLLDNLWARPGKLGSVINVHADMRLLALDTIGAFAFGVEFGAMDAGGHEIETRLSRVLAGVLDLVKSPLPLWRVMRTPARAAIEDDMDKLRDIELSLIRARRARLSAEKTEAALSAVGESDAVPESASAAAAAAAAAAASGGAAALPPPRTDLLGLLLAARDSDRTGAAFTDDDLRWDVHDVIFAGHETTASALGATLFLVAGDERVCDKILDELRTHLGDRDPVTPADVDQLEYLGHVLNEALRLYPPTALVGRVSAADDVVAGYAVPAGSSVLMSPYALGRLETLWPDAEAFRPERFEPAEAAGRHPLAHIPFGAGPRVCLGARIAVLESKIILAMVLRRFVLKRTTNTLEAEYASTVSFPSGMDMRLRRRPSYVPARAPAPASGEASVVASSFE
ncbi:hypothetical protein I4F81_007653 [Pyropia yezoensis]|uniref:Uncharacterized protein n=1 Tax=Pyropia yezoensis TaxID=2788 RepID=A0ACC3C4V7_PYRYE|nr:hypothetical protein I4F81_007653 [Neopyropia yezoensis]